MSKSQLVNKTFSEGKNSITITDLPRSQSYIFEANGRKAKIAI
jgi:hypothetical protein